RGRRLDRRVLVGRVVRRLEDRADLCPAHRRRARARGPSARRRAADLARVARMAPLTRPDPCRRIPGAPRAPIRAAPSLLSASVRRTAERDGVATPEAPAAARPV